MSGHSKWSTIKRKKGAADAKRGAAFTKLAGAITIAAKEGGSDQSANFALRLAIEKARGANMPNANIERAIARGAGTLTGEAPPEHVNYEGYGPGGVALLVECLTDNRNRTVSEVRSTITKRGGSLGEAGSVAYLFQPRGVITIAGSGDSAETVMLTAVEAGASDVEATDGVVEIQTTRRDFRSVKEALEAAGNQIASAELVQIASSQVPVTDREVARSIVTLVSELEDLDDVVGVATNADIEPDLVHD